MKMASISTSAGIVAVGNCIKDADGKQNPADFTFTEIGKDSNCVQCYLQD